MTNRKRNLNQLLSLMTVASNELIVGFAEGWLAPTLNSLSNIDGEFYFSMEESSWIASLDHIGTICGAIFAAFLLDVVGRKVLLTSSALSFFLMWIVIIFTKSAPILCAVRFIYGFFTGLNDGTNSAYMAENSSPVIRGVFGAVTMTIAYIGLLAEFIIATHFSYRNTAIINTAVSFFALLSVQWIKEPAQFLLMKGKPEQAKRNFAWLRGTYVDDEDIKVDFERIKQNVEAETLKKSSFKRTLTSPANYKSLFIMITLHALFGCTGYYAITSYAPATFSSNDLLTENEFTILFGIAQTLVVATTSTFIERFNRRTIILICFSLIALSHAVTTGLYHVNSKVVAIPYFPWFIFMSITFYACVNAFVFPAMFVIRGELFPLSVKAMGGCLSVIAFSATNFLTTVTFLYVSNSYGMKANFLLFALLSLITVLFVYKFLPETRNKSLIEIQEKLENRMN